MDENNGLELVEYRLAQAEKRLDRMEKERLAVLVFVATAVGAALLRLVVPAW